MDKMMCKSCCPICKKTLKSACHCCDKKGCSGDCKKCCGLCTGHKNETHGSSCGCCCKPKK